MHAKSGWASPREREATRKVILEAANKLVGESGPEALSFSTIAAATGIARATLYGYFSSKGELLTQLGEDPTVADGPTENVSAEPVDEAKAPSPPAIAATDAGDLMHEQAKALDALAQRVLVPKSMMKGGTETVIAKLEARLAVFEKACPECGKRVDREIRALWEKSAATSNLAGRLQESLDAFEKRQQQMLAEMRLELHNLTHPKSANPAPTVIRLPVLVEAPTEPNPPIELEASEPETVGPPPPAISENPDAATDISTRSGYISSARRAAIDAAKQTQAVPRRSRYKTRVLLRYALGAAILIFLVTAFLVLRQVLAMTQADAGVRHTASVSHIAKRTLAMQAAGGDRQAQLALGLKLMNGTGVAVNVERGVIWLERAAAAGLPVAQNLVGVLYQTGTGVNADMAQAARWYEAAAQQGNVKAMTNLGKLYAGGWPQRTDYTAAARWFSAAASYGDVDAEFDLAVLYERGQGVSRSIADAFKWYSLAGAQGDANAAARASILSAQLMPDELAAAEAATSGFRPRQTVLAANASPRDAN
ncbi:MAG: SEL1-like repeat protein [Alphaproteobacteria bacterium]|nr:SEL1-like repeat protein [Alphaproteobacteria bacterium]